MLRTVTSKVDSHRVNPDYQCLVYDLLHDPTFHYEIVNGKVVSANWMPTEDDVLEIVEDLLRVSPTFGSRLLDLAVRIPSSIQSPNVRSIKSLAELLL